MSSFDSQLFDLIEACIARGDHPESMASAMARAICDLTPALTAETIYDLSERDLT